MSEDTLLPFDLPSVARKKLSIGFDGGQLSSNAGVILLRGVEKKLELAARLAACIRDRRKPERIEHPLEEMLRLRMFAIAAGYEDADDCDSLRYDPIFKMAVGHAPESGDPLCSQPTMSRLENAPSKIEIARLMAALVDGFCESYRRAPSSITLDIDDTCDTVHGHQQLSLFNAHYDERCFLPIHIYDAASGKPVAMILRGGKTPSGEEVRTVLKHVIKRIRRHWPKVHILVRGDSHYGRDEAMEWCEETQGVDYVFGFAGNDVLHALTREAADAIAVQRALSGEDKLRGFKAFRYGAGSWHKERRFVARIEATSKGRPTRSPCNARSRAKTNSAASRPFATAPGAGTRSGALWRASRRPPRGWMCAMSSPRSRPAPGIFTRPSIARGETPRTSSSCTRASSPLTAPPAAIPKPTSSA